MANHISHAALPFPVKGARFSLQIVYLDADGDPLDPTTPDTERSIDAAAFADCTEEMTTISGSNGTGYITLTGDEMNASMVAVAAKVASGPKATIATIYPRVLPALTDHASGTAQAGAAGTITLASGAPAYDITGCIVKTTGGTGGAGGSGSLGNQARVITAYNTSTKVATVVPNWETTPDNTTTYAILLTDMAANAVAANAMSWGGKVVATPTVAGVPEVSVKYILGTILTEGAGGRLAAAFIKFFDKASPTGTVNSLPDAVAGAASGVAIVGSNMGSASSVTAGVTVTTNNDKTGYGLSAAAVQAVWDALTSALSTANSIGKLLVDNINATISSRSTYAGGDTSGTTTLLSRITALIQTKSEADTAHGLLATAANLTTAQTDLDDIQTRLPVALVGGLMPSSLTAAGLATDAVDEIADGVWDEVMSSSVHNTNDSAGQRLRRTSAVGTDGVVNDAAATTTSFVVGGTVTVNDFFNDQVLVFTTGALATQSRPVLDYDGATKTITLSEPLTSAPANAVEFVLLPVHVHPVSQIADGVWDEALAGHAGAGSAGEALSAAGTAGDPWSTPLPGAYGAGTAGKIIGDNMNAPVGDVPTNAELATALGTADDAVLAAIAALNNLSQANVRSAVGLASANLDTQLDALPTNAELATALGTADDAVLAAIAALNNLSQANIRTAVGLASANLDTQLGDLPTNAELTTALATADDAVLAAIAALNNLSQANVRTAVGLATANLDTQLDALPTNAELATALGTADDAVLAAIAALNNLSSAAAQAAAAAALTAYGAATTANVAAVEADTQDLQVQVGIDGAGLTAIGDTRLANLDVAVSTRSVLAAADVWAYSTRTLSSFGTLIADIWAGLTTAAANKLADHTWRRNLANVAASANGDTVVFRSPLGAMRKLVNKVAVIAGVLTIYDETDAGTPAGQQTLGTDALAEPTVSADTV